MWLWLWLWFQLWLWLLLCFDVACMWNYSVVTQNSKDTTVVHTMSHTVYIIAPSFVVLHTRSPVVLTIAVYLLCQVYSGLPL
jgi:hypothetical protein